MAQRSIWRQDIYTTARQLLTATAPADAQTAGAPTRPTTLDAPSAHTMKGTSYNARRKHRRRQSGRLRVRLSTQSLWRATARRPAPLAGRSTPGSRLHLHPRRTVAVTTTRRIAQCPLPQLNGRTQFPPEDDLAGHASERRVGKRLTRYSPQPCARTTRVGIGATRAAPRVRRPTIVAACNHA